MDKYIHRFPEQLSEALAIGEGMQTISLEQPVTSIVICGMGGSGIGGTFVKEILQHQLSIPIIVNQEYALPAFAGAQTFVICSSYSGNTEETLSALHDAMRRNCKIACITTGGEMEKIAAEHHIPYVKIPGGMPPRTCLGYSLTAQLYLLHQAGFTGDAFKTDIRRAAEQLSASSVSIREHARSMATEIQNKIPVVYTSSGIEAVGKRWKQQVNENAKMHCFSNVVPEMNHNELVSYAYHDERMAAILLRIDTDAMPVQKRFEIMKELISDKPGSLIEVHAEGESMIGKMFYLVHLGDWLSYELAKLKGVDPIDIGILDALKERLSGS